MVMILGWGIGLFLCAVVIVGVRWYDRRQECKEREIESKHLLDFKTTRKSIG